MYNVTFNTPYDKKIVAELDRFQKIQNQPKYVHTFEPETFVYDRSVTHPNYIHTPPVFNPIRKNGRKK